MALPTPTTFKGVLNSGGAPSLTGGTAPDNLVIRLFDGYTKYLDPTETPFTSSLETGGAVNQKKVEWFTGFLSPHQVALGANQLIGATTITFAAGDGAKVMPTHLLKVENEIQWVTSFASADVANVTRSMGGTAAAAHNTPITIDILSPAAQENADTPLAPVTRGALEYNLPQLMDYAIHVSNRENNTPDYEFKSGNLYDNLLAKRMKEAAIEFEKTAILGRRGAESSMVVGGGTPTTLGGLDFFTDQGFDMGNTPITESAIADALQFLWQKVGDSNMPKQMLVGGFVKRAISSQFPLNRQGTARDDSTKLVWNTMETDFGTVKFVLSRYIPAGTAYFLNTSDIEIRPYKGGTWAEYPLPANGPYKRGRFTGDYTMIFRNNAARYKLFGISTNKADYPGMIG